MCLPFCFDLFTVTATASFKFLMLYVYLSWYRVPEYIALSVGDEVSHVLLLIPPLMCVCMPICRRISTTPTTPSVLFFVFRPAVTVLVPPRYVSTHAYQRFISPPDVSPPDGDRD